MHSIQIGQIIYHYNSKSELYYKITKNFYLKYREFFERLRCDKRGPDSITIPFINGIQFHFDISPKTKGEWKWIIENIQKDQLIPSEAKQLSLGFIKSNEVNIPLKNAYRRKKKDSSYLKLFPNKSEVAMMTADFVTAIHSVSISEGIKLENYIYDEYDGIKYESLDFHDVIKILKDKPNETILFKKVIISRQSINENTSHQHTRSKNLHLDLLILYENILYIDELKDGESLDTKKSDVEIHEIKMIKELFENITNFKCCSSIVLWTCKNISNASIKTIEANDYILRGRDLCKTLKIDFDLIEHKRRLANEENLGFAMLQMEKIIKKYKQEKKDETTL